MAASRLVFLDSYSGSAAYIDGRNFLWPIDVPMDEEASVIAYGVDLTKPQMAVSAGAAHALRDNGTATVFAASKGQMAFDGPAGGNSPFTSAFLRSLGAGGGLEEIFNRMRIAMAANQAAGTSFKQDPYMVTSLRKDISLNLPERDPPGSFTRLVFLDSCMDNP